MVLIPPRPAHSSAADKGNMPTSGPSPYYDCILYLNGAAGCGFRAHLHFIAEQIGWLGHIEAGKSLSNIAAATGGSFAGRPRHSRIFRIASGGLIAQSILFPRHSGGRREHPMCTLGSSIGPMSNFSAGSRASSRPFLNRFPELQLLIDSPDAGAGLGLLTGE